MTQDLAVKPSNITSVPIAELIVPPWNPRKIMDEDELNDLVAFMEKGGRVPRLLVWKGNGHAPWAVISGQKRLEAHRRLKREPVDIEILDITLKEAKCLAIASNQGSKPYWLDDYTAVEDLQKENPDLKQRELAESLGWSPFWVNRAIGLTGVLNPASRQLIRDSQAKKIRASNFSEGEDGSKTANPAPWEFTEYVAYRLTDFWGSNSQEEAQALVEKALPVILSKQLNGPQVKQLVAWVKTGQKPEDFEAQKAPRGKKANSQEPGKQLEVRSEELGARGEKLEVRSEEFGVKTGKDDVKATQDQQPSVAESRTDSQGKNTGTPTPTPDTQTNLQRADSPMESAHPRLGSQLEASNQGPHTHILKELGLLMVMGVKWALGNPLKLIKLFWGWVKPRLGKEMELIHGALIAQAARWVLSWVIFFLIVGAGLFLFSHFSVIHHWLNRNVVSNIEEADPSSSQMEPPSAQSAPSTANPMSGGGNGKAQAKATSQKQKLETSASRSHAEGQALNAPIPEQGIGASNQEVSAWVVTDTPFVAQVAERFYGISYNNCEGLPDFFKQWMRVDLYPGFMQTYFPQAKVLEIQEKKIVNNFKALGPPKFLGAEGITVEYQVLGEVATESRMGKFPVPLSTRPVAMDIKLVHDPGNPKLIGTVIDAAPEKAETLLDQAKAMGGDIVKDTAKTKVNRAADKAEEALDDVAKRTLGF